MDHPADLAPFKQGLTPAEAATRLAAEGFNELPRARRRSALRIVAALKSAGAVVAMTGDGSTTTCARR